MTVTGTCESCGSIDEPLLLVQRLYVTPEAWDSPGEVRLAGEEWWCIVCRSHYPHQPPGETPPDPPLPD